MQGRVGDYGTRLQPDIVCVTNFTMQGTSYSALFFFLDTWLRKHASSEIKGQIAGTGRKFHGQDRDLAKARLVNFR